MAKRRLAVWCALALVLVTGIESRGARERIIAVQGHDPVRSLEIGELVDTNGKGKKFTGQGTIVLADGRRIGLGVTQKHNAKKLTSTFKLKSQKKTKPKVNVTLKTVGDPEQLKLLKVKFKDQDGTKAKVKEKAGSQLVAIQPADPVLSARLALDGVRSLVDGEETFDATVQLFDDSIVADFRNEQPVFFRAVARFLETTQATAVEPAGNLRSLWTRAGLVEPIESGFWNQRWGEDALHDQGQIKDGAPHAGEVISFMRAELDPALETFLTDLGDVPTDFEYRISGVDALGAPFDGDPADDLDTVWVDIGDVEFLRSATHVLLATTKLVDAYDWNDVDPNDFDRQDLPGADFVARVETSYPALGTLARHVKLVEARNQLALARQAYERGATHVLGESAAERDNGLFTPFRDVFRSEKHFETPEERDAFITSEAAFRTYFGDLVDSFEIDVPYPVATKRDGTPIPADERYSLNVFQLLDQSTGVDPRALYFKVITDPMTNQRALGVTSLGEITPEMRSASGVLDKVRGVALGRGDLMSGRRGTYALRIDAPPEHTKTVDGDLAEWVFGTNSVQVFEGPRARYDEPRGGWGDLHLSLGTNDLFLGFDGDPDQFLWFSVEIDSAGGFAEAELFFGGVGDVADPTVARGANGAEFSFPLSNFGVDRWVEIRLMAQNTVGEYLGAGPFYVRID